MAAFVYEGRTIYEWCQSLEEVRIFFTAPPGIRASQIDCVVTTTHLRVGLKGNAPLLDRDLWAQCVEDESTWSMDGSLIEVSLQKMKKAETWEAAIRGHGQLDPMEITEAQKKLTLERFQQENPGFDFSGAEFSGMPPDPRTFMGGVKYT